jgi:hypothetical protein
VRGQLGDEADVVTFREVPAGAVAVVFVVEVAIDVVGVDGVAAQLAGESDTPLDPVPCGLVLDVDPTLVAELGLVGVVDIAQQPAVFPSRVVVAVAYLGESGVEVAYENGIGVVCLGTSTPILPRDTVAYKQLTLR